MESGENIKPLQDAGIKVLLGTLPDHDNFTYHSIGPWPWESNYSWNTANNPGKSFHSNWYTGDSTKYPLSDEKIINNFVQDLVDNINTYGLDGFDMDDEWGSSGSNASTKGVSVLKSAYGGTGSDQMAQNIANFIYRARLKFGDKDLPGDQQKIINVYRVGALNNDLGTSGATFGQPTNNSWAITPNIWKYATCGGAAYYGSTDTSAWVGIPRMQYSPSANGFHSATGATNSGTYTNAGKAGDPYGYIFWYGLSTRASMATRIDTYIANYSKSCFGEEVVYRGADYPQDWPKY